LLVLQVEQQFAHLFVGNADDLRPRPDLVQECQLHCPAFGTGVAD